VTFGVLTKNNEVTAIKACGISVYRLTAPVLIAGLFLSGSLFAFDHYWVPEADRRQDAIRAEIKGRPAQTYFQPAHQWIFGENSKIYNYELFDPDQQLFGGLSVFELDPSTFQLKRRVFASRANWAPTENTWALTGGWVRDFDANGPFIRVLGGSGSLTYSLQPGLLGQALSAINGVQPQPPPNGTRPPLHPNTPCETQTVPDLYSPSGLPPNQIQTNLSAPGAASRFQASEQDLIGTVSGLLKSQGLTEKISQIVPSISALLSGKP